MPDRMSRTVGEVEPRRSRLLWVGLPVFTVFAAFGVIVWLAYQENARVPSGEPPLIRAVASPYKLAPDDPGGRQLADQGEINTLLRDEPGPALPERVLPLPEEPRAPVIPPSPASPPVAAPPDEEEQPATVTTGPAPGTSVTPTQSAGGSEDADARQEAEAALARLLADVGPEESPARPSATDQASTPDEVVAIPPPRPARPPSTTAPTVVRSDAPQAAPPVDAPSREADAALARLLAEVAGVPVDAAPEPQAAPASPPPGAVAAIAPADPAVSRRSLGPGFRVQLAAVRDQDDARRAWADLVDRLGPVVADYQPFYERADTVNGVFYRIQLGPFASEQTADRLCVEVQRRNASCFVVAP